MHKFRASQVTALRFSTKPDRQGHTIPPKAVCITEGGVPVIFDTMAGPITIGKAMILPRQGLKKNELTVDMVLVSKMRNRDKALTLIQQLYPCVIMKILDASRQTIRRFSVEFILLTADGNCDPGIVPLGVGVMPIAQELDS